MKSFRDYISEVVRDVDRAVKLGNYLAKRHAKHVDPWKKYAKGKEIHFVSHNYEENHEKAEEGARKYRAKHASGTSNLLDTFENTKPTRLKVSDLHPIQDATDWTEKHYRDSKSKDKRPIRVIKHEGKHYVWDGHHRWLDHKLRGETHISARVLDADED